MTEYRHGGDVYRNKNIVMDYSINLNPLGMPDFIREAAVRGVALSERYPDSECGQLKSLTADFYGVPEEALIFGNGAAELIYGIVRAKKPKKAAVTAPAFTEYERALRAENAEVCRFYLKEEEDFSLPVDEFLSFLIKEEPDMIFLCNPANPAGNRMEKQEIGRILDFCMEHGIFAVLDECFLDFCGDEEELSAISYIRDGRENLFLLKAFTKSFSMAGLRLGAGFLSDKALLEKMRSFMQPWNVSVPAQEAGCAAFGPKRQKYLLKTRELIQKEREYLKNGLFACGFKVFPSEANFLLFKDSEKNPERALYDRLLSCGILIRCCDDYEGLNGRYYRICVKPNGENRRLLEAISKNI